MKLLFTTHVGGPISIMLRAKVLLAFACHCNKLLDKPENIDDPGQELMQYIENGYLQLIAIDNQIVIMFKVNKWWLIFTENEGLFLSIGILAKQKKLLGINFETISMELVVSPKTFWSGSIANYRISYEHGEVYSSIFIAQGT